jgi:hypothetical protein
MGVPDGSYAIAAFIVIALPGFIYAGIRRRLRGEYSEDRDVSRTIARGATFAVALTAIYLLAFGDWIFEGLASGNDSNPVIIADAQRIGLTVLVLYIAIPAVLSVLLQIRHIAWRAPTWPKHTPRWLRSWMAWVRYPSSKRGYDATPTAWDHSITRNHSSWVKVKRGNGEWVGGWYTKGSFATTYPEARSIYIDRPYTMTDDGAFGEATQDSGVFLMINDDDLVFWETPGKDLKQKEHHND